MGRKQGVAAVEGGLGEAGTVEQSGRDESADVRVRESAVPVAEEEEKTQPAVTA